MIDEWVLISTLVVSQHYCEIVPEFVPVES